MRAFIAAFGIILGLLGATSAQPSSTQTPAAAVGRVTSRVRVSVPQADSALDVEGERISADGTVREFLTQPLERGKRYEFKFSVRWRPNNYTYMTREKMVTFTAGDEVTVDLTAAQPGDRAEIKFVPTPVGVVDRMIQMAFVTKNDVVYEPGCGDARITIAAVKAGARAGVCIDIDPERVSESKRNARDEGVEDKVEIRLGDALDIKDLSNANVVFLYMGNEFDMLIRPILWKQLKVGSRVVSHRFTMGDWEPDRTATVSDIGDDGDLYQVHLWTITEEVKRRAAEK